MLTNPDIGVATVAHRLDVSRATLNHDLRHLRGALTRPAAAAGAPGLPR